MNEKEKDGGGVPEKLIPDTPKPAEDPAEIGFAKDQRERGYYYDDAHGYQNYDPDAEEPEIEESAEDTE